MRTPALIFSLSLSALAACESGYTTELRPIGNAPSTTEAQAIGICETQARNARALAQSQYRPAPPTSYSGSCQTNAFGATNCSVAADDDFASSFSNSMASSTVGQNAYTATKAACLNQYGWQEVRVKK